MIIFNNWLKVEDMDNTEKKRLKAMVKSLNTAIQANSELWFATNSQDEKKERERQNNYNR
jgi:hypothetical protein